MRAIARLFVLLTALWLLAPEVARAAVVTFEVCVNHETDFVDADMGDKLTADINPALGVAVRFIPTTGSNTDVYMDWSGADKGCNDTIALDTANGPFVVKVLRKASVNGNTLRGLTAPGGSLYASTVNSSFTPTNAGSYTYTTGPSDSINILMAASFAMAQSNGGVTGQTFDLFDDSCPGNPGISCERYPEEGLYVADGSSDQKRVIAHEFGHTLADAANGGLEDANDETAALDGCAPAYSTTVHRMNSKEYSGQAFVEGFAHFYSAVAFNTVEHDADCELWKAGLNWDLDANAGEAGDDPDHFSCSEGFTAGPSGTPVVIPEYDYVGEFCLASGVFYNRATEYDFLRAMWDLATVEDVDVETIFAIWVAASPDDWARTSDVTCSTCPYARMLAGANTVGGSTLATQFSNVAWDNGIMR